MQLWHHLLPHKQSGIWRPKDLFGTKKAPRMLGSIGCPVRGKPDATWLWNHLGRLNPSIVLSEAARSNPSIALSEAARSDPSSALSEAARSDPSIALSEAARSDPSSALSEAARSDPSSTLSEADTSWVRKGVQEWSGPKALTQRWLSTMADDPVTMALQTKGPPQTFSQ